jgi:hypothetical protein
MSISDLHIIMILDESGSMSGIRNSIIESVNGFVNTQKQTVDNTTMTLVKFNDRTSYVYKKRHLLEVPELDSKSYTPDKCTALYDAIGTTIKEYHADNNVCMVIVTDGEENASRVYQYNEVQSMIADKKEAGWKFIFLSSDLKAIQQGDGMGFQSASINCLSTGSNNVSASYMELGKGITRCAQEVAYIREKGCMRGMGSSLN